MIPSVGADGIHLISADILFILSYVKKNILLRYTDSRFARISSRASEIYHAHG
jgi:hypothetical protein